MRTSYDEKTNILNIFLDEFKNKDKIIDEYGHKPIEFLAKKGSYYPPKLKEMFLDIYFLRVLSSIWVGPRGGGKTYGLGDIAAAVFIFLGFDVLIASGGEGQAKEVYEEVTNALDINVEEVAEQVLLQTTQITKGKKGNWIRFVPASTRRARGPHPGRGHGGVIILDEEAEMEEKIVNAIIGTGSTAMPLIIIRASTAHNIDGTFADLLENYDQRGYKLYQWDSFDVCQKCERNCEECIPEFRDEYCKGKAHNNSHLGWISLDYLFRMWRDQTKEWFEVELMGMRPSGSANVVNREDLKEALVDKVPFVPGAPVCIGIDWGFKGMTAIVATQKVNNEVQIFDRMSYNKKGIDIITDDLLEWKEIYGIHEIYADSSHAFNNDYLLKAGFKVTEIIFGSFKDAGASTITWYFEKLRIKIPRAFKKFIKQLKKWRRDKNGKIVKIEDHYPDALLCTMKKWWKRGSIGKTEYMAIEKRRADRQPGRSIKTKDIAELRSKFRARKTRGY